MSELERRAYKECRIASEDGKRLGGHAIVFNSPSLPIRGQFIEYIAPEAVDRTLKEAADVRGLVDHDSSKILGRTRAGTMSLSKDSRGLRFQIEPDLQISYAHDIMRSVMRGDVSGMSFQFATVQDSWNFEGDLPVRTVLDMTFSEISVVTFPAYPDTHVDAALRSLQEFQATRKRSRVFLEKWHKTQIAK